MAGGDGEAFAGVAVEVAIHDIDGNDAVGGGVAHVHQAGVGAENGARGRGAQHHVIADFVRSSVDDLQAVSFGRDQVEFTAVGLEQHLRGAAGQFEMGEKNAATQIDDGDAGFAGAAHEGDGAVGHDGDVFGARDDRDGAALGESRGVMKRDGGVATIGDDYGFAVGSAAGEHRFATGFRSAEDGARAAVDCDQGVVAGRGDVRSRAVGGKVERVR